ncbi:MAG: hypothetical protein KKB21_03740 [Nanoarchaeota archaeon]|nr:hypothetical protein [Nanoarchaeota archaeon]MBU4086660.1 hypothetical protein [Nanoarchaeota archaeon]
MANLKESDIVLCTVERIDGTTVFVKIETGEQGTIITSEIAPGRIRNIRDYVSPGRRIVCKVLKVDGINIYLSLRRVTPKEKKEVLERHEKERNSKGILKSVLGPEAEKTAEKIKEINPSISEFLNNCKTNVQELEKVMSKEHAERICKILQEKKEKQVEEKRVFSLSSKKPEGIKLTKELLSSCKGNCSISYVAAGKFTIRIKAQDFKKANHEISNSLLEIEKKAKENKMDFSCDKC